MNYWNETLQSKTIALMMKKGVQYDDIEKERVSLGVAVIIQIPD